MDLEHRDEVGGSTDNSRKYFVHILCARHVLSASHMFFKCREQSYEVRIILVLQRRN